jgi:hypothetical protein
MTFLRESAGRVRRLGWACVSFGLAIVLLAACSADTPSPPSASSAAKGRSSTTATTPRPTIPRNVTTTTAPPQSTTTPLPQATTTTAPFLTSTTASGTSQPLDTAQNSQGVFKGDTVVVSISNVMTDASNHLTFTLNLRNTGTLPYNCAALKAQARTEHSDTAIVAPVTGSTGLACPGADDLLDPGQSETFAFYIPLVGGTAQEVIVVPYGSYASRVVWSVSGS